MDLFCRLRVFFLCYRSNWRNPTLFHGSYAVVAAWVYSLLASEVLIQNGVFYYSYYYGYLCGQFALFGY